MKKLLSITVGQSPRDDIFEIIRPHLYNFEIIEEGALDGLTKEEIKKDFYAEEGDYILESRLKDGDYVIFSKEKIIPRIQEIIKKRENEVDLILMLCTGKFKEKFHSTKQIIFPQEIIQGVIPKIVSDKSLLVVSPDESQIPQSKESFSKLVKNTFYFSLSPYVRDEDKLKGISCFIKEKRPDVILLDCMGYKSELKEYLKKNSNSMIIQSNILLAKILNELG